jgi:hypothetical protein
MNNFLRIFDLYKKPITLPIQSQYSYSNITGFIVSITTYIVFSLHLYFESYEVFAREHPTVISNKNNIHFSQNSSLKLSNETLKFFIWIGEYNVKNTTDDLLNYFEIHSNYITESKFSKGSINFTQCEGDYLSKENFNIQGIKLCPKIDFSIPINSFKKFEWKFDIRECLDEARGCKRNPELYKNLRNGNEIFSFLILTDFEEDMLNFTQPYEYDFRFLSTDVNQNLHVQLKGSEIKTQSLFGFYEAESRLKFSKHNKKETIFPQQIFSYTITFNSKDMTLYQRIYKTFTGAFSNAYSLFKFYSWLFSIVLNIHYSYSVNNVIINTNFDYRNSMKNSDEYKMPRNLFNTSINSDLNQKEFPKEHKNGGAKQQRLTLSLIYKKVSCCRIFFYNKINSMYDLIIKYKIKSNQIIYLIS